MYSLYHCSSSSYQNMSLKCLLASFHPGFAQIVPNEILTEIFSLACVDGNHIAGTECSNSLDSLSALSLSMVCTTWRAVAHSIPSIWTRMNITIRGSGTPSNRVLETYLSRSRSHPLTLQISIMEVGQDTTFHILERLAEESCRWYSFFLDISRISGGQVYRIMNQSDSPLTTIRGNLPLLEHLRIVENYTSSPPYEYGWFNVCPKIRVLQNPPCTVASANLHSLNFARTCYYVDEHLEFYLLKSNCPRLEKLIVPEGLRRLTLENEDEDTELSDFDQDLMRRPRITNTTVKSLVVRGWEPLTYAFEITIWNFIVLPNLEELKLIPFFNLRSLKDLRACRYSRASIHHFKDFLNRGSNSLKPGECKITTLYILCLPAEDFDLFVIEYLHLLSPSLETLALQEVPRYSNVFYNEKMKLDGLLNGETEKEMILTERLLAALDGSRGDQSALSESSPLNVFLPKLKSLELGINSDIIHQAWKFVRQAIESRIGIASRRNGIESSLENFTLTVWDENPDRLRADPQLFEYLHSDLERMKKSCGLNKFSYSVFYKDFSALDS